MIRSIFFTSDMNIAVAGKERTGKFCVLSSSLFADRFRAAATWVRIDWLEYYDRHTNRLRIASFITVDHVAIALHKNQPGPSQSARRVDYHQSTGLLAGSLAQLA